MAKKSYSKKVMMGVKRCRFKIWDEWHDKVIYTSTAYSTNGSATRGGKRYCARMNYRVEVIG